MQENITQRLLAISPLDGRYHQGTQGLAEFFSEFALMRYRVRVEIEYLIAIAQEDLISELQSFDENTIQSLRSIYEGFSLLDADWIKNKEQLINHDVKAVEYFIKDRASGILSARDLEWIHFALTSEDINNIAYALILSDSLDKYIIPKLELLVTKLQELAKLGRNQPMLARTHGQSASPTCFGKEVMVFVSRLQRQLSSLRSASVQGKLNGATGNYNAHHLAYPQVDWTSFSAKFITSLNSRLEINQFTTQIENHDSLAEVFAIMQRINSILLDLNQDFWRYISDNWLIQKPKDSEVGSSTMPHKVNPIDFENSEGNLGLANALFVFFSQKLLVSRLQRDLSDSTTLRNIGSAFAYSSLAYDALMKGLGKIQINTVALEAALEQHPEVLTEAVQTILRREGIALPYEKLKDLSRGKALTMTVLREFIQGLDINQTSKDLLLKLEPRDYIGIAAG